DRTAFLRQRFATGHADVAGAMTPHFRQDVVDVVPLPAMESVLGVAPYAAQRAAGQTHEHRRPAGGVGLALDGVEDLADAQTRRTRRRGRVGGWHGTTHAGDFNSTA